MLFFTEKIITQLLFYDPIYAKSLAKSLSDIQKTPAIYYMKNRF